MNAHQLDLLGVASERGKVFYGNDQDMLWRLALMVAVLPDASCPFGCAGATHDVLCIMHEVRDFVRREGGKA